MEDLVHHHYSGKPCQACKQAGRKEVVEWINSHVVLAKGHVLGYGLLVSRTGGDTLTWN